MAASSGDGEDVDLTTLLNILIVLVSFLMLSAVFSKISIQELNMPPQGGGGPAPNQAEIPVVIEVVVRKDRLEIGNGKTVVDTIPNTEKGYDLATLSLKLRALKDRNMTKKDVILLVEPDIDYANLINVMDSLKFAKIPNKNDPHGMPLHITLFPNVTVGDAPI